MFWRSPPVIPTHPPGSHGPPGAPHLCVSLVVDSASNFAESAYFGYPYAHEDDAQRAVRTGLGILAALGDLNSRLQQAKGIQLALRVGIHTGLVVIGEMGGKDVRNSSPW